MFEDKIEIKTYKVIAICTECYIGEMKPTGIALSSYPPKYPHICNKCGYAEQFYEVYPCIRYEEV